MHLVEEADQMPTSMLLHEAGRQFTMAEIVRDGWQRVLYERGGWYLLLCWAERVEPCAGSCCDCGDGCGARGVREGGK